MEEDTKKQAGVFLEWLDRNKGILIGLTIGLFLLYFILCQIVAHWPGVLIGAVGTHIAHMWYKRSKEQKGIINV